MTDLAKLVVKLEAQTADYMKKLDQANSKLDKFNKTASLSAKNIAGGLVTAAGAAATAFGFAAKAAIDSADNMSKLSQSVGVSTEVLSQLNYAADLSGTSLEELEKAMKKVSKNAFEAAQGGATQAEAFANLGVEVQDASGKLKTADQLILEAADAFARMEDGTAKAAMAQELFGKSGAKMIPFLNQGADGIRALMKEADDLGVTLDSNTGRAAEQFNDNLTRVQTAASGLVNQFLEEFLPTLTVLSDEFVASLRNSSALEFGIKALSVAFKGLLISGVIVKSVFETLGRVVYGVGMAVFNIARGEFRLAAEEVKDAFGQARDNVSADIETIVKIWEGTAPRFESAARVIEEPFEESILFNKNKAASKAKDAAQAALEQIQGMVAGLQQQVATFGMAEEAIMRYRIETGDLAATFAAAGAAAEPYKEQLIALTTETQRQQEAAAMAAQKASEWQAVVDEGARITESVRTPLEEYEATIKKLNEALQLGVITQDTYNRAVENAQEAFDKANEKGTTFLEQASRNTQDILAQYLEDPFSKGLDGMVADFGKMLMRMAAQALAADIAGKIFGSGGVGSGGGWLGQVAGLFGFGGVMDSGGRGVPGQAYLIGKGAQPEMFVPDRPGTFIPNADKLGGMQVVNNFSIVAPGGRVSRETEQQIAAAAARGIAQANRRNN